MRRIISYFIKEYPELFSRPVEALEMILCVLGNGININTNGYIEYVEDWGNILDDIKKNKIKRIRPCTSETYLSLYRYK